jgi:hypothetical protein
VRKFSERRQCERIGSCSSGGSRGREKATEEVVERREKRTCVFQPPLLLPLLALSPALSSSPLYCTVASLSSSSFDSNLTPTSPPDPRLLPSFLLNNMAALFLDRRSSVTSKLREVSPGPFIPECSGSSSVLPSGRSG